MLEYGRSFAVGIADGETRALLGAHLRPFSHHTPMDRKAAMRSAIGYLIHAQQHGPDAGMGSYHLLKGWGASYPETTGYAIPTLIAASDHLQWQEPLEAAVKAAEWLLSIQRADGGWQGGRVGEERPSIVFNTAQVIRGMLEIYKVTEENRFLDAASSAAGWIAKVQDADGAWRTSNFLGVGRVYDTYVDAPLLAVHSITNEPELKSKAEKNLHWVLEQRLPNGWFGNCDNTLRHNDRPITHTIAYTLDGLLECASLLRDDVLADAATTSATVLLEKFLENGSLNGRYDAEWRGSEYPIMTGCAQLAIVWSKIFERTGSKGFRDGVVRMTDQLMHVGSASAKGPAAIHGALPGSYPLWGRYEKFAFPNWATKYFADALLCAERIADDKVRQ